MHNKKVDSLESDKKIPTTRIRQSIYGRRVMVSLRLTPELRQSLMALCDELHLSANMYITNLIEKDLKSRKK